MITLDVQQELAPEGERLSQALLVSLQEVLAAQLRDVPTGTISVVYVSDNEIQRLNRMYRKKDYVTDVLSFSYVEQGTEALGDVVISHAQAKRQAEGDLQLELVDLIAHGVLHVLGYDHERPEDAQEMFPLQDTIVANVMKTV